MRKLIVHEFITLDGVIQAPGSSTEDTEGGFTHGGWTQPYWHDEIGAHFGQAFGQPEFKHVKSPRKARSFSRLNCIIT